MMKEFYGDISEKKKITDWWTRPV